MLTRRSFVAHLAVLPLALDPAPRVTVVGAGAFGGWTALHLRRLGARVTLVDAWGPGNARSSSGGETRVIRAVYGADAIYVELVRRAYELWEQLDPSLYVETGVLWMHRGGDGYVRASAPILREHGFPLETLALADAKRRWPQIDFTGIRSVWLERRAGVLSARQACVAVRDAFVRAGGTYRTMHVDPDRLPEADATVFACGPWLGRLFPEIPIAPTRQEVFFFGTPAGAETYQPARLPVWIDFGERVFYGVPDTHGRGFKIADDTRGEAIDPTGMERVPSSEGIARARRLLAERFPALARAPLVEARVCQYENSPDGHLILDRHPSRKNVWIAGGGSGHGFKLAPAVGELMARAILSDAKLPEMFALARRAKQKTQFDK
ncbi:MAG TPA: FAD-dependent oxidoreductase [Thermoanaerobaculia bacterium]|nr:FAD-dependent oxidoreductase [Thermoanaerobaculia bacterium]